MGLDEIEEADERKKAGSYLNELLMRWKQKSVPRGRDFLQWEEKHLSPSLKGRQWGGGCRHAKFVRGMPESQNRKAVLLLH